METMDDATVVVRDARAEDRPSAQAVTLAAYQEYARDMPAVAWENYRRNQWETVGNPAPAEHIVAELEGAIAGSVLLLPPVEHVSPVPGVTWSNEWPEVRLLAVAPEARGRGIARVLMAECVQRARSAGFKYLTLHTSDEMQVAGRLYARLGFVRYPELDFAPAEGVLVKGYRLDLGMKPR
jgi:GNAT superfamily N-acetyltransferase